MPNSIHELAYRCTNRCIIYVYRRTEILDIKVKGKMLHYKLPILSDDYMLIPVTLSLIPPDKDLRSISPVYCIYVLCFIAIMCLHPRVELYRNDSTIDVVDLEKFDTCDYI